MKTSIFNMTFTLPPLVEITEVDKEMSTAVISTMGGRVKVISKMDVFISFS